MRFGLKESFIRKINAVFAVFPEIEEVIIYGSRAIGSFRPGSDIDLTLKGKELNLNTLNKVGSQLDDLLSPYTFDLSFYDQIDNAELLEHIKRVGQILYSNQR